MTPAYDVERVMVECRALSEAAASALRHPLPEWMAHRLATIRMEADGLLRLRDCDRLRDHDGLQTALGKKVSEMLAMTPEERAKENRAIARSMADTLHSLDECQEEHMEEILAHYAHAREKHPYFCDWVQPQGKTPEEVSKKIASTLANIRNYIEENAEKHVLGWDDLLNCEVWEVFEALATGNKAQAVEELYDCIAILLRTVDVLEGRQPLGKPPFRQSRRVRSKDINKQRT